ncbi:hypothetical protein [Prosthecomicrobium sp. N25]|uniref:hypothetical protein n=1 Tax=Prosthecomicrobium sp. N25 TaxID=3129254 RepID=UPI003076ECDA
MDLSLPGAIGAGVGLAVGLIDYGLIAMLIRRAAEKANGGAVVERSQAARLDLIMKVVFVVNCLVFAGLGYWFGAAVGG